MAECICVQLTVLGDDLRPRQHRWWEVSEGVVRKGEGEASEPEVSISLLEEDWQLIQARELKVIDAFRQGRMKVRGSLPKALEAAELLGDLT